MCLLSVFARILKTQATPTGVDVLTHRYDTCGTGANLDETILTTRNVAGRHFDKVAEREVDGDIFAQPLIKTGRGGSQRGGAERRLCGHGEQYSVRL